MNRKKKIEGLLKKRLKRARAKQDTRPKGTRYISKADRAKAESAAQIATENTPNEADAQAVSYRDAHVKQSVIQQLRSAVPSVCTGDAYQATHFKYV